MTTHDNATPREELWLTIPIEECTEYGFHMLITDDDGYCNFCGYQEEE